MIDLISTIKFLPSYPQLKRFVSSSRYGGRAISFVDYADPIRIVDLETVPLFPADIMRLQAWIAAAREGIETIVYRPTTICIPQAYWGDADNTHIIGTAARGTVTNGLTVQLTGVVPGLMLQGGDLVSFTSGTYRQMSQIVTGATAVSTQMSVTVDQPIAAYIAAGSLVRFKHPELNTRIVPGSFQMSKGFNPTASFQLVEVPR